MIEINITITGFCPDAITPVELNILAAPNGELRLLEMPKPTIEPVTSNIDSQSTPTFRWKGQYGYSIFGEKQTAPNQAARLVGIFRTFAELAPEQLPELSRRLVGRTRRPLATDPTLIYPSRHLVRHARAIAPGWFIDTNTDTADKITMIKCACKFLGLEFGREVVLIN